MNMDFNPELDLQLTVDVPISPEQLFEGWTRPDLLPKWFCPRPWKVVECTIEPKPGGAFNNVMQSPEGQLMPENKGCFLWVEKPRRIVWTGMMSKDFKPNLIPQLGFGFVCDLNFMPLPEGGTRFQAIVRHVDSDGKNKHEQMGFEQGWKIALSQLVELQQSLEGS